MSVTVEDVRHVARLARLELRPEEIALFTNQLNGILAHVEELGALPEGAAAEFTGVSESGSTAESGAPLRSDVELIDPLHAPVSAFAAAVEAGFLTVPRLAALDTGAAAETGA